MAQNSHFQPTDFCCMNEWMATGGEWAREGRDWVPKDQIEGRNAAAVSRWGGRGGGWWGWREVGGFLSWVGVSIENSWAPLGERLEVESSSRCSLPRMVEDQNGATFCGESWCYLINPKSLKRELNAPGQRAKLEKCLSATGLMVTICIWIAWKIISVFHICLSILYSLCDVLLVNFGY